MNYRIKQYENGFVVEVQKKNWFGKMYWTHFIHVRGIPSEPWYHSNYQFALINLLNEIKWNTMNNS